MNSENLKLLVLAVLSTVIASYVLTSCTSRHKTILKDHAPLIDRRDYTIFGETVNGCEYLILDGHYAGGIIHAANCKNPKHATPCKKD